MNISVEISMYPLTNEYEAPILKFIEQLHQHPNLKIMTNTMSTQIFGTYEDVMSALTPEIRAAFMAEPTTIMVMKIINADLVPEKGNKSHIFAVLFEKDINLKICKR